MASIDPIIGKKLGDYMIVEMLGQGGMARVYRGYDSTLNRSAAVKVFDTHLITDDSEEYRQRFQNEARAIARLNHPNIIGVYQFGQFDEGELSLHYMAMSFVEGKDLRYILRNHARNDTRMIYPEILRIIRDIASALDYAHAEGVIHRDIKPSNIMITPGGRAIITDFGLALNVSEGTIGTTFGSAHYIAPEQAVSSAQAVPQSDLYSLGVCLFEMLTNRVPFNDPSAMAVAMKHLNDQPPPPSRLNPNIGPRVDQVVLKILQKAPNKRYQTGQALVDALEQAFALSDEDADTDQLLQPDAWGDMPSPTAPRRPPQATAARRPAGEIIGGRSTPGSNLDDVPTITDSKASSSTRDRIARYYQMQRRRFFIGGFVGVIALALVIAAFAAISRQNALTQEATGTAVAAQAASMQAQAVLEASGTVAQRLALAATGTQQAVESSTASAQTAIAATEAAVPTTTPTPSPTDTPIPTDTPTATLTPTSTPTPTDTPVPVPTIPVGAVLLQYDRDSFVLINQSDRDVDVSALAFVQVTDTRELRFETRLWETGSRPTNDLPPGDCFQVFRDDVTATPQPDSCGTRHAFFRASFTRWFWLSDDPDAVFEIRRNGVVLATCSIAAGLCAFDPR